MGSMDLVASGDVGGTTDTLASTQVSPAPQLHTCIRTASSALDTRYSIGWTGRLTSMQCVTPNGETKPRTQVKRTNMIHDDTGSCPVGRMAREAVKTAETGPGEALRQ